MADAKRLIIESPTYGTFTVLYDAEDHDKVSAHRWGVHKDYTKNKGKFYVTTHIPHPDGGWVPRSDQHGLRRKRATLQIHRLITEAPKGMHVDHINGNPLDNRKSNLRICTHAENQRNRGANKNNTSGYKGVSWHKRNKKWACQIKHNYKKIHVGNYATPEEAARAYDAKAKEFQGEFAYLNFPDE